MYFSRLLKIKTQNLMISFINNVLNFGQFVPPVVWVTMELQTGYLEDRQCDNFFIIISFYYELFSMTAGLNIEGTKAVKMLEKYMESTRR